MFIICTIIIIWAIADGSLSALIAVMGRLLLLGLGSSSPELFLLCS